MSKIALVLVLFVCSVAAGGTKTYSNRNGSVQFRAVTSGNQTRTYDSRGTFSGSYSNRGNSVQQTQSGFRSAKPNSTFNRR